MEENTTIAPESETGHGFTNSGYVGPSLPDNIKDWPEHLQQKYEELCKEVDDHMVRQQSYIYTRGAQECTFLKYFNVKSVEEFEKLNPSRALLQNVLSNQRPEFYTGISAITRDWLVSKIHEHTIHCKEQISNIKNRIDVLKREWNDRINEQVQLEQLYGTMSNCGNSLEYKLLNKDYSRFVKHVVGSEITDKNGLHDCHADFMDMGKQANTVNQPHEFEFYSDQSF
jgi:hypothetical protein